MHQQSLPNKILDKLQDLGLTVELLSIEPLHVVGGESMDDSNNIKVFTNGFSLQEEEGALVLKLPSGQFTESFKYYNLNDVVKKIVKHYQLP